MYIKLRVITEAKEEKVEELSSDSLRVWVKEKAEQNRANKRVLELVKTYYKATRITLVNGHHNPSKIVSLE